MLAHQDIKALEVRLREISADAGSRDGLVRILDENQIPPDGVYVLSELYGADLKAKCKGMMDHGLLSKGGAGWSFELLGHFLDGTKQYAIIKEIYNKQPQQGDCLRYVLAEDHRGLIDSFNKFRKIAEDKSLRLHHPIVMVSVPAFKQLRRFLDKNYKDYNPGG